MQQLCAVMHVYSVLPHTVQPAPFQQSTVIVVLRHGCAPHPNAGVTTGVSVGVFVGLLAPALEASPATRTAHTPIVLTNALIPPTSLFPVPDTQDKRKPVELGVECKAFVGPISGQTPPCWAA